MYSLFSVLVTLDSPHLLLYLHYSVAALTGKGAGIGNRVDVIPAKVSIDAPVLPSLVSHHHPSLYLLGASLQCQTPTVQYFGWTVVVSKLVCAHPFFERKAAARFSLPLRCR